tara:strand:- start:8993 stop:9583 length:591 start_codon:yes stop_codon:yes gene_type:complete
MNKALIIFIKNAVAGKVKTRLAQGIGEEMALKYYKALLNHTRTVAEEVDAMRYLYYSESVEKNDRWDSDRFIKRTQEGADLGARMYKAFQEVKEVKKIIIGSDCPQITTLDLEQAFDSLDHHELVIGPANDGGYYLLGVKEVYKELFLDMEWSVESVFKETKERANKLNLKVKILRELVDLDTVEDLKISGFKLEE